MLAGFLDKVESSQPWWLNESSPFIYLAAGLVLALAAEGALAKPAGTLLILYGLRIVRLRWKCRGPRLASERSEAARKALRWHKSLACRHEGIDDEHRELFAACHKLLDVAHGGNPDAADALIRELISKIEAHYHREEKILHEYHPAGAILHQHDNHALSARTHALHRGYLCGRIRRQELIDHIIHQAVVGHARQAKIALEKPYAN